jgi:hypothetical protein|tara:strand:- start:933 stop:1817 length:885 start_codon:yes stop_codon:yes gene_type:complete
MKTIDTLVHDMEQTIFGHNGWDKALSDLMSNNISTMAEQRFSKPQEPRGYLSLSGLGTQCERKLWYKINRTNSAEPLPASTLLKFFYGDIIEELVLTIAAVSGHNVTGMQDRMDVHGIKGHRDAVIDGMTVDVKSASPYAFKKFKEGNLREDDPFGYISQLSSYVYAAKDDPKVTNKTHGAFLVIDKVNGSICLDIYDFTEEMKDKEKEVAHLKEMVLTEEPPERSFEPVPQSAKNPNGNEKLAMACSYCDFKKECYPNLRKFVYSDRPLFLTKVVKKPLVAEDLEYSGALQQD